MFGFDMSDNNMKDYHTVNKLCLLRCTVVVHMALPCSLSGNLLNISTFEQDIL